MAGKQYRELLPRQQALVALAVLLDGNDAAAFLVQDARVGQLYRDVAEALSRDDLEMRLPYIGTLYREAVVAMSRE